MSKERLEEIAFNVGVSLDGEKALMSSDDYDFLYNYALEQTERVQELEKEIEDWRKEVKKWQRFFREESQQNKRYREALDKQFKEFWEACVKFVGEDTAYSIVAEMPKEESK